MPLRCISGCKLDERNRWKSLRTPAKLLFLGVGLLLAKELRIDYTNLELTLELKPKQLES